MECLIASDNCKTCQYNVHAFMLHDVKVRQVLPNETGSIASTSNAIIVTCPAMLPQLTSKTENQTVLLTCPSDMTPFDENTAMIRTPYKWSEIFSLMMDINQRWLKKNDGNQSSIKAFSNLAGQGTAIGRVKEMVLSVANSGATVLLRGESGTGKDVIATAIHQLSNRRHQPFIPVNCGAIPHELMESELFGHMKGAFTGALHSKPGRFEIANGGTLFLDEIGDMPANMQVKLLRVLQDQRIQRIGSNESHQVDVRIIAATNRNLENLVEKELFRSDLYYRVNVFPIQLPALRERKEDIEALSSFWLDRIRQRTGSKLLLSSEAISLMKAYSWPGNIRELQNFLERICIIFPEKIVTPEDIADWFNTTTGSPVTTSNPAVPGEQFDIREYICGVEKMLICEALEKSRGILDNAANMLNLSKTALSGKIKKYQIDLETA